MAVVVVGDLDPAQAEQEIIKHFSSYKNPVNEKPRPAIIPIAERKENVGMVLTDKEQTYNIFQVFNYVEKAKRIVLWNDYRKSVVEGIFNSLLNQRLSELTQQANPPFLFGNTSFNGFVRGYRAFVSIAVVGEKPVKDAVDAVINTTESVRKYGFLQSELDRAKSSLLNATEKAFNDKDKTESGALVNEYVTNFLQGSPIIGITNRYNFIKQITPSITLEDVNAIALKMESAQGKFAVMMAPEKSAPQLPSNNELLSVVAAAHKLPVKAYEEKTVAKSLMDKMPVAGKIVSEKTDAALGTTDLTLSNGVTITIKPTDFKNDEIKMDAWRLGGFHNYALADKENAENAAIVAQSMGVKDLSPVDLRKFLAGKTISVQPYINPNDEGIEGSSSIKDFETFLQLINLYFTQPRKDLQLFQSFITTEKSIIKNMKSDPNSYFSDTLTKIRYNNSPWASGIPDAADFDKINIDRVFNIYKEIYGNAYGMHFTFVGNVDIAKAKSLFSLYLGSLPSAQKENKFTDVGLRPVKGVVEATIAKGAAKKSLVNVIFTGDAVYSQEEDLKLDALMEVLNIKIIEQLREEMSGIYGGGMRGGITKRPYNNYSINVSFPCGPENVDKLTKALFDLIKTAQEKGIEQKELDKVKETYKKQNEDQLKRNDHWLNSLSSAWIENDDPKWIFNYSGNVDALTVQDLQTAAKKYFNFNNYIKAVLNPEKSN
jgi:zinc protease